MIRAIYLYSPAAVCGVLAVLFSAVGRTDGIVIAGATALAVAMVLHTYQEVHDHNSSQPRRAGHWLPERWYRDLWLFLISIIVAVGVFNADNLAEDIQSSRVEQTGKACHERNAERKLFRDNLTAPLVTYFKGQRKQTEELPPAVFVQFDVAKPVALRRIDKVIAGLVTAELELAPLNCKARVQAVRDTLD